MRPGLHRVAAVTAAVTGIDLATLAALRRAGLPVPVADGLAVAAASVASWNLHGQVTFADDPYVRWIGQPRAFVVIAAATGALDVTITSAAGSRTARGKALALAAAGSVRFVAYRALLWTETRRALAHRVERPPPPGDLRLSVVVPAYEEAARIAGTVAHLRRATADLDGGIELIVVDDGSQDDTAPRAAAAGARVVRLPVNRGKGAAVRAGVRAARGRTVVFTDADLAYPPEQVLDVLAAVEAGWDVAVGSRRHPSSTDRAGAPWLRVVSGRAFNLLTATVLLGQYRDTQCGLKGFRSDAATRLFGVARLDGFAFDVEVLHLVERWRLSLTEVPVTLVSAPGSSVRVGVDALRMVRDLFRVRRLAAGPGYDQPVL